MEVTEIIRLTNPRFYSQEFGRFTSQAFTNNGAGASVVATACVQASGQSLCDHLDKFYTGIGGIPPVFLRLSAESLADGARLEQSDSPSGDKCHYDIVGMSKGQLKKLITGRPVTDFEICAEDGLRNVTEEDAAGWPPPMPAIKSASSKGK